jgi:hypothetical protein
MIVSRISDLYIRFEKYISAVGLIYGFIFTSLTLTRVDTFLENFWIVANLLLASFGIIALTFYENRRSSQGSGALHFWLIMLIQFSFGGLFSTFFVFYLRSSSFSANWLFLFVLIVLLVGNEIWKKHYSRLAFQISVLFVSIYLFLIFLLPVLFHRLGADLFILSGALSLLSITFFVYVLKRFSYERFRNDHNTLSSSILSIVILMNLFYFTGVIPPIPLSLKDSGVYHSIMRTSDGDYIVETEPVRLREYFLSRTVFNIRPAEKAYVFSAIFSPINFSTEIIHDWQYYSETTGEWQSVGRVSLPIIGGRDGGFRTYSSRQNLAVGLWRVRILSENNRLIGTQKFEVRKADEGLNLIEKVI